MNSTWLCDQNEKKTSKLWDSDAEALKTTLDSKNKETISQIQLFTYEWIYFQIRRRESICSFLRTRSRSTELENSYTKILMMN